MTGAVLVVGYSPWVPNLLGQSETALYAWKGRPLTAQLCADEIHTAVSLTPVIRNVKTPVFAWCVTVVLGGGLLLAAFRGGWAAAFLLWAGGLPVLLLLLLCQFSLRNVFYSRYFAFAQPMWLAAFALVVASVPSWIERNLLALLLALWSAFSCYNAWTAIGPGHNPGMREAVGYVLAGRSADEPVVSETPYELFKLAYYMRHTDRPLLCVSHLDRRRHRGASHLLDGDLATPEMILRSKPRGLWVLTSTSYDRSSQTPISLPQRWKQIGERRFKQDYPLEYAIKVRHYRLQ
jgi:hypothetical protein